MNKTRLHLDTAPKSMLGILTLTRALTNFGKIAEGVEKALEKHLKERQTIVWRMTYNWKPDDGESGKEMIPEYQPIMFGNVCIINNYGWQEAVCAMTLDVDCYVGEATVGCSLNNCAGNTVETDQEKIIKRISSDLHQFLLKE